MSHGVILAEEQESQSGSSTVMKAHPFGRSLQQTCPVCKYLITPYNSSRFCYCDVYAHGGCVIFMMGESAVNDRKYCEICRAPYNVYFENRADLSPLSSYTFLRVLVLLIWFGMVAILCLLLIQLINHSIENESVVEEFSYLLFSSYLALFVLFSMACFSKIIIRREATAVGIQPYFKNVIYVQQPLETKDEHQESKNELTQHEVLTSKQLVVIS